MAGSTKRDLPNRMFGGLLQEYGLLPFYRKMNKLAKEISELQMKEYNLRKAALINTAA
jgi:hypothetical protein